MKAFNRQKKIPKPKDRVSPRDASETQGLGKAP